MQPTISMARAYCWRMFNSVSTRTPGHFSAKLLSCWFAPVVYWCLGLFIPMCRIATYINLSCCLWHLSTDSVPGSLWLSRLGSCVFGQRFYIPSRLPDSDSMFCILLFYVLSFSRSSLFIHAGLLAFLPDFRHFLFSLEKVILEY